MKKTIFPDFPILPEKLYFEKFRNKIIGNHNFGLMLYRVTKNHFLASFCKNIEGFIDFSSLNMNDVVLPMIFT